MQSVSGISLYTVFQNTKNTQNSAHLSVHFSVSSFVKCRKGVQKWSGQNLLNCFFNQNTATPESCVSNSFYWITILFLNFARLSRFLLDKCLYLRTSKDKRQISGNAAWVRGLLSVRKTMCSHTELIIHYWSLTTPDTSCTTHFTQLTYTTHASIQILLGK